MNRKQMITLLLALMAPMAVAFGQYSSFRLHSHNDYRRVNPFYDAVNAQFGSIEADIWIADGKLLVAHDKEELPTAKSLEEQYIKPFVEQYKKNGGHFYKESDRYPLFLIDLKTGYATTLQPLIDLLRNYPEVFDPVANPLAVRVVVSGAVPPAEDFVKYDAIVSFDGRIKTDYTAEQLTRIGLISDAFTNYLKWQGVEPLRQEDFTMLKSWVDKVHDYGKPVRFWATPDTPIAWDALMKLGVDYINTDKITESAAYVKQINR